MKRASSVGILVCMLVSFHIVSAQETEEDQQADSTETSYLSEIIISANRWEQNLREVPGKVTTVNNELVQFQNPQTAADLLGISNHVFVQKSQLGGGSPMIRGFATNRVLLVVDGVRMNNAIFRSGNVQNVISLDANAIEEAEVVFGPGSVIYGSDAIGGVMDFHTLKPAYSDSEKKSLRVNALSRYSSANREKTGHVNFNIGLKHWAFLTSISRSTYDDLRMGSDGPTAYTRSDYVIRQENQDVIVKNEDKNIQRFTGYDQWNAMQKISFRSSEWFEISYAFHYSKTSDYPRYDRLILKENDVLQNAEWYYGPQKWMMHAVNLSYSKPNVLFDQTKFTVAFQDYRESRHNRSFGSTRRTDRTETVKALSMNLDLDKKFSDLLTIYYGAEFITNEVGSVASRQNINTGEIVPWSTRYPNGADWRTYAAYLSLKIKPSDKWIINLSNRFTGVYTHADFDKNFFNFPFQDATLNNRSMNGSLGLIFSPSVSWKFYTNFSSGFRSPNVDDIGKVFDSEPGNVVVPNPGLEPERAYNAEAGVAGFLGDKIKIDIAVYHTTIDNAIARGSSTFNGQDSIEYDGELSRVLSLQNISKIMVAGIQAGMDYEITDDIKLTTTLSYQKGKEKDPETGLNFSPTHVAPLFGSTHVMWTKGKIKVDLFANYNGAINYENLALTERADRHLYARDENGNPYSPSWITMNFKGSWKVNKNIIVNAGIENILDKRYRPYSSGLTAPGRNFILSLRAAL